MARFLFAWELGSNFGHMTTFNGIARELSRRGHSVHVALQNLTEAERYFNGQQIRLLQAPVALSAFNNQKPTQQASYVNVIDRFGFQNTNELIALISAWRSLYEVVVPDVVILNAPPVSLLAARKRNFKLAVIGPGYHYPPRTVPLPLFDSTRGNAATVLSQEQKLVTLANQALEHLGLPKMEALRDLFDVDSELLTTFQELDHFPERQGGNYVGAQFSLTDGDDVPWPAQGTEMGADKRIFVYARPKSQHFQPLMAALRQLPMRVIVAAPGITETAARAVSAPNIRIHPGSVRLARIREECDLAISAGGHGTMAAFLLAGVPIILLPNHTEQLLGARAALRTGGAIMPMANKPPPFLPMIRDALTQPRFRARAQAFADKYKGFEPDSLNVSLADRLESMAGGAQKD